VPVRGETFTSYADLVIDDPSATYNALNNVTFLNQPANVDQLTIRHPGFAAGAYSLSSITWFPISSGNGAYLNAQDADAASPQLVVNVLSNDPGNGPAFTKTSGGASVVWGGTSNLWTGNAFTTDWFTAGNWSKGSVPTATDDVVIPVNSFVEPIIAAAGAVAQNLTVQPGATLTIDADTLTVSGNVLVPSGGNIIDVGAGALKVTGTGKTVSGDIGAVTLLSGSGYTLGGLTTAGNVTVGGSLALGGFSMIVAGDFVTTGTGTLAMTSTLDNLSVGGNAVFGGGNTTGLLTQGSLVVSGDFTQQGAANSFAASGTHTVSLAGAVAQNVSFANPGAAASHFQNLTIASATAGLTMLTNLLANGSVTTGGSGTVKLNNHTLTVAGNFATSGPGTLTMQNPNDSLIVGGAAVFAGGSTTGLLTSGVMTVASNFQQLGATTSFAASGTHKTVMTGSTGLIQFTNPGSGAAGSHFNTLDVTPASGGLALGSSVFVDSALIASVGAAAPKIVGSGNSVTAREWVVTGGLVVDNAPMVLNEGTTGLAQTFNGVTFQGFPTTTTTAILIDVSAAGSALSARTITFSGTQLQMTFGAGSGTYVRVASSNGIGYTLVMAGSNDPTGGFSRSIQIPPAAIQYQ